MVREERSVFCYYLFNWVYFRWVD